jgi:hypothetical protein
VGHVCIVDLPDGRRCPVDVDGDVAASLVTASGLRIDDPWIGAVVTALAREPRWIAGYYGIADQRRSELTVRRGGAEMFHASPTVNRSSILEHGLDWTRMSGRSIAGSRSPEAPAVFLNDDRWGADWFARMGQEDGLEVDIWAVDASDDWIESGPDGWWMRFQRVSPNRLRLVQA